MIFHPDMIDGIQQTEIPPNDLPRYRAAPVNIMSFKFDWLLEKVAEDDRQPYIYRLLNEIEKKAASNPDDMDYYDIPVVQAMIRFHHSKL